MSRFQAVVVAQRALTDCLYVLRLRVGPAAAQIQPGQFLFVRCGLAWDPLLRRPLSPYRIEREAVELLVEPADKGTRWLLERAVGDELDCLGPHGRGFQVEPQARNLLLVGSGRHVASLVALAQRETSRGRNVTLLLEAPGAAQALPASELPAAVEYVVARVDEAAGDHEIVPDLLSGWLGWAEAVAVYVSGPERFLAAVASVLARRTPRTPAQAALERPMACGTGVCSSCLVALRRGVGRVCREGPVFDLHQVAWGVER